MGLLLRRRTQFLSSREAEQKSDFLARFSEWQPLAAERPEGPRADSPCKQSPAPAATWLFSFHDLLTSSKRIPAWPRQEILPGWNALETPIREREATGPAGERSQSHIPHGPPPDSLRPKASGSPVLTSRICTESSHTGHSGSPLGWGTAPRHSLAGQGEVAGFRDRSCGSGVDEQARLRGGSSPGQWSYPRPLSPPPCPLLPTRPSSPPHPSRAHRDIQPPPCLPRVSAWASTTQTLPSWLCSFFPVSRFKCPLLVKGRGPLPARASIPALFAHQQDWSPGAQPREGGTR